MRLFIVFFLITFSLKVPAQSFQWSAKELLPATGTAKHVIYDKDNSAIVSGQYDNNKGLNGSFLMKYDKDGKQVWKFFLDRKLDLTLSYDRFNNLILAAFAKYDISSGGFVINKYDLDGNEIYSNMLLPMIDGGLANKIDGIAADNNGGYVIAGTYQKNFKLGQFSFPDPPPGEGRFYAARFNDQDSCLWAINASGDSWKTKVSIDKNNDILISSTPTMGKFKLGSFSISPSNSSMPVVFKINQQGEVKWMTEIHSSAAGYKEVTDLCTDSENNVYTLGFFGKDILLPCGALSANSDYSSDIFLLKLGSDGTCHWLQKIGGIKFDSPAGLAPDLLNGGVFIAGNFAEQCTIGNISLSSAQSSTSSGVPDAFIAKYNKIGQAGWAVSLGADTCGQAMGKGLAANGVGEIYFTGTFKCRVDFGNQPQTSAGVNVFLTKLKAQDLTGLATWAVGRDISFFPNPSTGIVRAHMNQIKKEIKVVVFNIMGEVMLVEKWLPHQHDFVLDLSPLARGMYVIHCSDGDSRLIYKQIIN